MIVSIQIDNNQFTILVKKYLDDRQYIKTLEELENVDTNIYPAGLIAYCEEDKSLYKRDMDDTWCKIDVDQVEPYLFIYEEDEDGNVIPDEEQPIYARAQKIPFEDILNQFINKEEYDLLEQQGVFVSLDISTDENKMYSQSSIDVQAIRNDQDGKAYLNQRLLEVVKPGFAEVSDVSEMIDAGTFYLLESALNPGEYAMYIIDEQGSVVPLGSKQMSLSNYQHLDDEKLETESKSIVGAINELNLGLKMNNTVIGDVDNIKIESDPKDLIEALNYCQLILNRLGDIEDLNIEIEVEEGEEAIAPEDITFIDFLNQLDKISGPLNRLTTTNRNNFVASLNSFYGVNVPPGSVFPYVGNVAPAGYLMCDGEQYDLSTYPRLYSAIGFNFGVGTSSTMFRVPDFTDRTIVGYNPSDIDFDTVGKLGGEASVVLESKHLPSHRHYIATGSHSHIAYTSTNDANITSSYYNNNRDGKNSGYSTTSTADDDYQSNWSHTHTYTSPNQSHYHDTSSAGYLNPTAHENRQPYRRMNFIIKY